MRVRLLPLTLFVAASVLFFKIEGLFWQADRPAPGVALAEPAKPDASDAAAAKPDTAAKAAPLTERSMPINAIPFTQTELDLLQKLSERREVLEARERDLRMREDLARAAEQRLDTKSAELEKLKSAIRALVKTHSDAEERKLKRLVKIYENMKPKDAARIFDKLAMDILLDVIRRMREAKTAAIMAKMDAAKAERAWQDFGNPPKISVK